MSALVMDASVVVPLLHGEAGSPAVRRALARWGEEKRRLCVPGHFWLEILNALGRGHQYTSGAMLESLRELDEMGLETIAVERPIQVLTLGLMERHGLTSYDASYLALAESLDAGLATIDRALAEAAGPRWVDPLRDAGARLSETRVSYDTDRSVDWPRWSGAGAYLAELRARALAGKTS